MLNFYFLAFSPLIHWNGSWYCSFCRRSLWLGGLVCMCVFVCLRLCLTWCGQLWLCWKRAGRFVLPGKLAAKNKIKIACHGTKSPAETRSLRARLLSFHLLLESKVAFESGRIRELPSLLPGLFPIPGRHPSQSHRPLVGKFKYERCSDLFRVPSRVASGSCHI